MSNRNQEADYRYGYQGKYSEKEELGGTHSFELRLWDARIGRWTRPDPYGQFTSPYLGMGNSPIKLVDPDGGATDDFVYDKNRNFVKEIKNSTNHILIENDDGYLTKLTDFDFRIDENEDMLSNIASQLSSYSSTGSIAPNFISKPKAKFSDAAYYIPGTLDIAISYNYNGKISGSLLDYYSFENAIYHEVDHWKGYNLWGIKNPDEFRHAEIILAQTTTPSFVKSTKDWQKTMVYYFGLLITNSARTESHSSKEINSLINNFNRSMKNIDPTCKAKLSNDKKFLKVSMFGVHFDSMCKKCY